MQKGIKVQNIPENLPIHSYLDDEENDLKLISSLENEEDVQ